MTSGALEKRVLRHRSQHAAHFLSCSGGHLTAIDDVLALYGELCPWSCWGRGNLRKDRVQVARDVTNLVVVGCSY